jgi:hypothetical protein
MKASRFETKEELCVLCGTSLTKTCNSHSIPKFILSNISVDGSVIKPYGFNHVTDVYLKQKYGLNEAGIFRSICLQCDSKWFSSYENDALLNFKNLKKEEQNRIMAQIYLKSSLYRKYIEKANALLAEKNKKHLEDKFNIESIDFSQIVAEMNVSEYNDDIKKCISIIQNGHKIGFKLMYYRILDYTAPIAFQTHVCLHTDLKGKTINDVFDYNPKKKMQLICVCSFPIKNKTILMSFMLLSAYAKYDTFVKQFNRLDNNKKILLFQNSTFAHSEDVFISPKIVDIMRSDEHIREVFSYGLPMPDLYSLTGIITSSIIDTRKLIKGENYFTVKYRLNEK